MTSQIQCARFPTQNDQFGGSFDDLIPCFGLAHHISWHWCSSWPRHNGQLILTNPFLRVAAGLVQTRHRECRFCGGAYSEIDCPVNSCTFSEKPNVPHYWDSTCEIGKKGQMETGIPTQLCNTVTHTQFWDILKFRSSNLFVWKSVGTESLEGKQWRAVLKTSIPKCQIGWLGLDMVESKGWIDDISPGEPWRMQRGWNSRAMQILRCKAVLRCSMPTRSATTLSHWRVPLLKASEDDVIDL